LRPAYEVRYSVKQDFRGGGAVYHSIRVYSQELFIDGNKGDPIEDDVQDQLDGCAKTGLDVIAHLVDNVRTDHFTIGSTEIYGLVKARAVELHTEVGRYTTPRGSTYRRLCVPAKRNVYVSHVEQSYIPEQNIELEILRNTLHVKLLEGDDSLLWLDDGGLYRCSICLRELDKGLLCNSCGATTHAPGFWSSHSFRCSECKKTICKNCAHRIRYLFAFRKILCDACIKHHLEPKREKLRRT
ncbi:MAG: hypothetical protein V3V35_11520, partial [Dehalococcoidia bacterium]